jgi:hypothetical protein
VAHTNWKAERRKRRRTAAAPAAPIDNTYIPTNPAPPVTTAYASPTYGSPGGYAETPGNVDLGVGWNPSPYVAPTSEPYSQGNAWMPTPPPVSPTMANAVTQARHRQGHGGGHGGGHHGGGQNQGGGQGGGQHQGQGQQYQPQAIGRGQGGGGGGGGHRRGPNWIQQRVRDRLGR